MGMNGDIRRNMALFPIRIVMKLTDLTARQIRYYEQNGLIVPERTDGNQRLFSFNDVERLLQIKSLIDKGVNLAGIKQVLPPILRESEEGLPVNGQLREEQQHKSVKDLRRMLSRQRTENRPGQVTLNQGDLSRYFQQSAKRSKASRQWGSFLN